MARLAGAILPGVPRHVTRGGHGRQQAFFEDCDDRAYRDLLAEHAAAASAAVWSWVPLPDHLDLTIVSPDGDAPRRTLAAACRPGRIHARFKRTRARPT